MLHFKLFMHAQWMSFSGRGLYPGICEEFNIIYIDFFNLRRWNEMFNILINVDVNRKET